MTLTEERRPQVIDICRRHHILIVEDNPYGLLDFEGQTYTALKTLRARRRRLSGFLLQDLRSGLPRGLGGGSAGRAGEDEAGL